MASGHGDVPTASPSDPSALVNGVDHKESADLDPPESESAHDDLEARFQHSTLCETCGANPGVPLRRAQAQVELPDSAAIMLEGIHCSEACAKYGQRLYSLLRRCVQSEAKSMAETQMMELQDIEAQYAMNVMQKFQLTMAAQALESDHAYDDRDAIRRLMLKLSTRCEKLPTSLFLMGVKCSETECYSVGSFADIYIGEYEGRKVALKRLRMFQMIHESKKNRMTAAFYYESLIWKNLRHQHVLTFLGVADSLFTRGLCMVLPWMPFGHIRHALDDLRISSPLFDLTPQIQKWIHEISLGLGYLHDEHVVHGDLRGANILIDENRSVRLADFGLAVFAEATSQNYASTRGGNARWLAPELIYPEMFELKSVRPTYATDVFAFGCVVIELYSGQAPYAECSDHQVVARVPAGLRPKRPSPIEGVWISDAMWYLATVCWKSLPSRRPSTHTLIKTIEEIVNTTNRPAAVSRSSSRTSLRSIEEEQNRERERQWNKPSPNNMRRRSETTLRVRISQERLRVAQANTNTGTLVSSPGPLKTSISDSPQAQAPKSPVTQNERRSVSAFDLRRKDEGVYDAKYIRERNWNSPQPKWGASSSSRSSPGPSSPSPSSPTPPYSTVRSLTAPSSASRRAGKKRASISSITTQIRELPETLDGPEPAEAPFSH